MALNCKTRLSQKDKRTYVPNYLPGFLQEVIASEVQYWSRSFPKHCCTDVALKKTELRFYYFGISIATEGETAGDK